MSVVSTFVTAAASASHSSAATAIAVASSCDPHSFAATADRDGSGVAFEQLTYQRPEDTRCDVGVWRKLYGISVCSFV